MRYEILGPIRLTNGRQSTDIRSQKMEQLLAILLIRAGQVVTIDQLIDELWGESVPRRAVDGLYVHVSQLRKFLAAAGKKESPIMTVPTGYLLSIDGDELDTTILSDLMKAGRQHVTANRYEHAASVFCDALSLWRSPILPSLNKGPIGYGFTVWLEEARLECYEMLIDAHIQLGRYRQAAGQLPALIAEHPLREVFYCQLMVSLYRSGRRADALAVYQRARRTLHTELGLEPCQELRDIQQAILRPDDNTRALRSMPRA